MPIKKPTPKPRQAAKKIQRRSWRSVYGKLGNKRAVVFVAGFALVGVVSLLIANAYTRTAADWNKYAPGIRQCESGGNYSTNTGNGYYGAYQFSQGTWQNFDGYKTYHYQRADQAPNNIQDLSAYHLFLSSGLQPWGCQSYALSHPYYGTADSTGGSSASPPVGGNPGASSAQFYLRNSNTAGNGNEAFAYGIKGDMPLEANWNGSSTGADTVGVFRPSNNTFYLRYSNTPGNVEVTASLGAPGDVPVVGDWDGNGTDTIGVFRPSNGGFYLRNSNTSGPGDIAFQFGGPGDIPISGNWGGNGADGVGVFRPSNGTFYIRSNDGSSYAVQFGSPGDTPVIGDWDHTGVEKIGVYRPSNSTFYLKYANSTVNSFSYGINGDIPVVGDWIGNGPDTIGVFRP